MIFRLHLLTIVNRCVTQRRREKAFGEGLKFIKRVLDVDRGAAWKACLTCGAGFLACYSCKRDARSTLKKSHHREFQTLEIIRKKAPFIICAFVQGSIFSNHEDTESFQGLEKTGGTVSAFSFAASRKFQRLESQK